MAALPQFRFSRAKISKINAYRHFSKKAEWRHPKNLKDGMNMINEWFERYEEKKSAFDPRTGRLKKFFLFFKVFDMMPKINPKFDGTEFLVGANHGFKEFNSAFYRRDAAHLQNFASKNVVVGTKERWASFDAKWIKVIADSQTGGYSVLNSYIQEAVIGSSPRPWESEVCLPR